MDKHITQMSCELLAVVPLGDTLNFNGSSKTRSCTDHQQAGPLGSVSRKHCLYVPRFPWR